jgi:hypothetical protein
MASIAMLAYVVVVMIPINWYLEVRADRIAGATSNHDLVNQAIKALHVQLTNERLKIARLRALETAEENNNV